jgi:hypothetical protein
MSVEVKFTASGVRSAPNGRYEDEEGREYRYQVLNNGALAIFAKEGGYLLRDAEPHIVYGPAAWFSVTGDPRTGRDAPGGFASA